MSLFNELKRRNVFRVGIAYAVVAWLVVQVADVMIDNLGAPDWLFGGILLVLGIGFPIVLVFAWAFELTPEGLKRESEVDRTTSIAPQTGKKLDRMIIGILVLAVAYLLVDKLVLQKHVAPTEPTVAQQAAPEPSEPAIDAGPSVAVLPFVNMSSDPEQEYFSDGLTETLLHMLAQLPELRVAARTSSFAFKGQNKSIDEIAGALGVAHILEGSVQKSGERIRVTAQLIRAGDGFHVWSQNYTRPLEDIFAIQDEIATDVAEALDASLLSGEGHMHNVETGSLTAYDLYLKAMEQQSIFSYGSLGDAERLFKQALSEDPDFIDAKLGLVRNLIMMNGTGLIDNEELQRQTGPLLAEVRSEHPDNRLAEALALEIKLRRQEVFMDPVQREEAFSRLRSLLPLVPTETYIRQRVVGGMVALMNQPDEALAVIEAGLMIDPLAPALHASRGSVYMEMDRLEDALQAFSKAHELDPRNPNYYGNLSDISARMGDLRGRLNWTRKAAEVDPEDHELAANIARVLYALELPEEGDRWARKVAILAPGSDVARTVELLRADAQGDDDRTLALAMKMIEDNVGTRGGALGQAFRAVRRIMSMTGRSEEAVQFLVTQEPDLMDFDKRFSSFAPLMMQWMSIQLMSTYRPADEVTGYWDTFTRKLDETGLPWREDADNQAFDSLMHGDIDGAAQYLLDEELNVPLAQDPNRHRDFKGPVWKEVASRPAMAARLAEWEEEFQIARADIQQMLLEPEWAE